MWSCDEERIEYFFSELSFLLLRTLAERALFRHLLDASSVPVSVIVYVTKVEYCEAKWLLADGRRHELFCLDLDIGRILLKVLQNRSTVRWCRLPRLPLPNLATH
ncbi:hypothetical protein M758_2G062600 [Ceratodon purpureus]|nr:hypothetical protein M758_2G062600 [Ceratodon purpureus]